MKVNLVSQVVGISLYLLYRGERGGSATGGLPNTHLYITHSLSHLSHTILIYTFTYIVIGQM